MDLGATVASKEIVSQASPETPLPPPGRRPQASIPPENPPDGGFSHFRSVQYRETRSVIGNCSYSAFQRTFRATAISLIVVYFLFSIMTL